MTPALRTNGPLDYVAGAIVFRGIGLHRDERLTAATLLLILRMRLVLSVVLFDGRVRRCRFRFCAKGDRGYRKRDQTNEDAFA